MPSQYHVCASKFLTTEENLHECAPTQTGGVICRTLEAVDIERRSPRAKELSKRTKKL